MTKRATYRSIRGFTLIELLVTLAVMAILLSVAVPSFSEMLQRNRLKSAAAAIYDDMNYARVAAIARGSRVYVSFVPGSNWCWGVSDSTGACNCNTSNSCTVDGQEKVVHGSEFTNVTFANADLSVNGGVTYFAFDPRRGAPEDTGNTLRNGTVNVNNANGETIRVDVNVLGRISQCSSTVRGYPTSC